MSLARATELFFVTFNGLLLGCTQVPLERSVDARPSTAPDARTDAGHAVSGQVVRDASLPDDTGAPGTDAATKRDASSTQVKSETSPLSKVDAGAQLTLPSADDASASLTALSDDAGTTELSCHHPRSVFEPDIVNARDLGGIRLPDGSTRCGRVFRGPPLAALNEARCAEFTQLGIRTVIDLRIASEVEAKPDAECVTTQAKTVLAPLPVPYTVSAEDYLRDLHTDDSMAAIFHTLGKVDSYPVYIHCTYGRDRTGIVAAAVLLALGASPTDVLDEYLLSQATVGAYPDSLQAVLDDIASLGGAAAYLAELGISDAELRVLRSMLGAER